jgi:hypothetical protein
MVDERDVNIDFKYVDEFGQESRLVKSFNTCVFEDTTAFELLVTEFKKWLKASGYTDELVDTIHIMTSEN